MVTFRTTNVAAPQLALKRLPATTTSRWRTCRTATTGTCTRIGSGFQANPMAARCGSRAKSTANACAVRETASPMYRSRRHNSSAMPTYSMNPAAKIVLSWRVSRAPGEGSSPRPARRGRLSRPPTDLIISTSSDNLAAWPMCVNGKQRPCFSAGCDNAPVRPGDGAPGQTMLRFFPVVPSVHELKDPFPGPDTHEHPI